MLLFMEEEVRKEARRRMSFPLSMSYTEQSPTAAHNSITAITNEAPQGNSCAPSMQISLFPVCWQSDSGECTANRALGS